MTTDVSERAEALFHTAVALHQQSRLDEAAARYQQVLQLKPLHHQALHLLGVVALHRNDAAAALDLIGRSLRGQPDHFAAQVNFGSAHLALGRFGDALTSYDRAIELKPDCAEAHFNRGNALRLLMRHQDAVDAYERATRLEPAYADAFLNHGITLADLHQHERAIDSYTRVIMMHPAYADAHYNKGNSLRCLGRFEAARDSYDKAIELQPGFADAHLNRASVEVELRRYSSALRSVDRAIALRPAHAEGYFNRAGVLQHLGRFKDAVDSYGTALSLSPAHAKAYAGLGRALRELGRHEEAITRYDRAMSLESDPAELRCLRRHLKMQICDWTDFDADLTHIAADINAGRGAAHPFYVMTLFDSPALQRKAAEGFWSASRTGNPELLAISTRIVRPQRIHVAYFSADFHGHATSYLLAQVLELHDRSRFHVSAWSFGTPSDGPMRQRIMAACDEFIDLCDLSDAAAAKLARHKEVDIAVDLKGFTQGHRSRIFSLRAAPIQINFLGYPGTLGAPHIDYIIADPTLVPAASETHFTEKIVCLPHSYQPNDATRAISSRVFSRLECGLPPTGFVYCCFNNSYKIRPATFDIWMRLLTRVPQSVLWLLGDNLPATRNLRREAEARNVDPQRLVFAPRLNLAEHLARHRVADLFLDTLPCNAHTTASDALWAGLPLITSTGEAFAGRVGASLLNAVGLPELIAPSPRAYEELAFDLAADPARLAGIRERLLSTRLTSPLFDSRLYTRHLETAFGDIHERYHEGLPPQRFDVAALGHEDRMGGATD